MAGTAREEIDALGEAIAETAAHIDAATHRMLMQIRKFDELGGWYQQGALSCAHWLSWRIGLSPGAAREKVRVARALASLPALDAALSRGEISYCKARAITRVATPETDGALVDMARHATGAELEKICRLYRGVQKQESAAAGEDDRRYVSAQATDDGMVRITAVVAPEESARILKAVDTAAARVSAEAGQRGQGLSRADGLADVAESYLRGNVPERPPVEVTVTAPRAALEAPRGRLSADPSEGSFSPAEIEERGVSAETARRLACDAGIVEVETGERGEPLDVGRKRRNVNAALRRALILRDGGCAFPGCGNKRFVDAHHIEHWADGGKTRASNLVLLCRRHHTLVHEGGFGIQAAEDGPSFVDPDGRRVPRVTPRPPASAQALVCGHDRRGRPITSATNMPAWSGQPADYGACVDVLVARGGSSPRARAREHGPD